MMTWLRNWWPALRRGEKWVGSPKLRGRVLAKRWSLIAWLKKFLPSGGPTVAAKARPIGTISARVYRKATGEWEDLGVISQGETSKWRRFTRMLAKLK